MKCKHCSTTWKLSGGDGPLGKAAPGHFLIVVAILGTISLVLAIGFRSIGALPIGILTAFIFAMSLAGCGDKDQNDKARYQGSTCPQCDKRTRILPWDF